MTVAPSADDEKNVNSLTRRHLHDPIITIVIFGVWTLP